MLIMLSSMDIDWFKINANSFTLLYHYGVLVARFELRFT